MFRIIRADLHIHTCLSPCATLDMTPRKIMEEAKKKNLGLIAIADHNSAENVGAVEAAGRRAGVAVIPGMEVTTSEEAHVVGLFETVGQALSMQALVYLHLQPGENQEDLFGIQVKANERDEVEGIQTRLLMGATDLPVDAVVKAIHELGGLAVAAHIDRKSFGLISQLGFVPTDLPLDALEISRAMTLREAKTRFSQYQGFPLIQGSDAHDIEDMGSAWTEMRMAHPTFAELKMALKGEKGRGVIGA